MSIKGALAEAEESAARAKQTTMVAEEELARARQRAQHADEEAARSRAHTTDAVKAANEMVAEASGRATALWPS